VGELQLTGAPPPNSPSPPTRWATDTAAGHSEWYIERFRRLAAEGADLAGEARLIDAMLARGSRVLDAGCGPGRVGAELAARGHTVVGVDADPRLIEAARVDHPAARWLVANLAELDLAALGESDQFDAAVMAGNVMTFVASGTEVSVLRRVGAHVRPGGPIVVGFGIGRGYSLVDFDRDLVAAGLRCENRFATWDLIGWHDDADFAVSVLRAG
jgi:SAM-dependent methyltransferase